MGCGTVPGTAKESGTIVVLIPKPDVEDNPASEAGELGAIVDCKRLPEQISTQIGNLNIQFGTGKEKERERKREREKERKRKRERKIEREKETERENIKPIPQNVLDFLDAIHIQKFNICLILVLIFGCLPY